MVDSETAPTGGRKEVAQERRRGGAGSASRARVTIPALPRFGVAVLNVSPFGENERIQVKQDECHELFLRCNSRARGGVWPAGWESAIN